MWRQQIGDTLGVMGLTPILVPTECSEGNTRHQAYSPAVSLEETISMQGAARHHTYELGSLVPTARQATPLAMEHSFPQSSLELAVTRVQ